MKIKGNAWTCNVPSSDFRGLHDVLAGVFLEALIVFLFSVSFFSFFLCFIEHTGQRKAGMGEAGLAWVVLDFSANPKNAK